MENLYGKQKVQNKWQSVECKEDCKYRLKDGPGKPMCNREGTLKFMLPEICTDKIWLMKITSNTAIEQLKDYIDFQHQLGNSLIGDYVIYLKEVEQSNWEGRKFKNKIVDIIKKEDFNSNMQIEISNQNLPQILENQTEKSTNNVKTVDNSTENIPNCDFKNVDESDEIMNKTFETAFNEEVNKSTEKQEKTAEKKATKRTTKTKKDEKLAKEAKQETTKDTNTKSDASKYDDCFMLISTETKTLTKDGKPTEYLFANFVDMKDKEYQVVIPPKYAEELKQCDLGTAVKLDLQAKGDKTFTNSVTYVEKCLKNIAA